VGLLRYSTSRFGQFLVAWGQTRAWSAFALGLPALAAGLASVLVLMTGLWQARGDLVVNYSRAANRALRDEDLERAELYRRKLANLNEMDPSVEYGIGLLALKNERFWRAQQIMERLAPRNATGYVPAHVWLARLYATRATPDNPEPRQWAMEHLERAIAEQPDHLDAHLMLAQLLVINDDVRGADEHMPVVANARPGMGVAIGRLLRQHGNEELAKAYVRRARDFLIGEMRLKPRDLSVRSLLADAHLLLAEFPEAEQILKDSQALATTDEIQDRLRTAFGGLYAVWARSVRGDGSNARNLVECLRYLETAVTYAPEHPAVLLVLRECAELDADEESATRLERLLEEMLARGESPGLVHLIIGTKAVEAGNAEKAAFHLEQAYQLQPGSAVVLANLSWTLANIDPPQYERALELINMAGEKLPNHPEVHETRGFILLKMGQPREALADLERALSQIKGRARLHEMLAEAYDAIGEASLAKRHQELAIDAAKRSASDQLLNDRS